MNRRKFLKISGLGITSLFALPGLGYITIKTQSGAVGLLMNELKYLNIDQKGVELFVSDFFKVYNYSFTNKLKFKYYYLLDIKSDKSNLVADLANMYLLSTDFFRNKMDEKAEVKYLGLYNPYKMPCSNPFSHLYYPSTVS